MGGKHGENGISLKEKNTEKMRFFLAGNTEKMGILGLEMQGKKAQKKRETFFVGEKLGSFFKLKTQGKKGFFGLKTQKNGIFLV